MPEITRELKPRIKDVMNKLFGIDTMKEITICIERLKSPQDEDSAEAADSFEESPDADTGL